MADADINLPFVRLVMLPGRYCTISIVKPDGSWISKLKFPASFFVTFSGTLIPTEARWSRMPFASFVSNPPSLGFPIWMKRHCVRPRVQNALNAYVVGVPDARCLASQISPDRDNASVHYSLLRSIARKRCAPSAL